MAKNWAQKSFCWIWKTYLSNKYMYRLSFVNVRIDRLFVPVRVAPKLLANVAARLCKLRTSKLSDGICSRKLLEFNHLKKHFFLCWLYQKQKITLGTQNCGFWLLPLLLPIFSISYLIFLCGTQAFDFKLLFYGIFIVSSHKTTLRNTKRVQKINSQSFYWSVYENAI